MSVNRDMRPVVLQIRQKKESPTGAEQYAWVDYKEIQAAIYQAGDTRMMQSVRYIESSHTGLTWEKDISKECRLADKNGTVYEITSADATPRLTVLNLKAVDMDG